MTQTRQTTASPFSDDDHLFITLRGACLVAALSYEAAFGKDPNGRTAFQLANQMVSRLEDGTL